jgi:hypothetical protein
MSFVFPHPQISPFSAAARLAGHVMQQEMFAQPLLTFLSLRALLQLLEEAPHLDQLVDFEESVLPRKAATLEEELSFTEENVVRVPVPILLFLLILYNF